MQERVGLFRSLTVLPCMVGFGVVPPQLIMKGTRMPPSYKERLRPPVVEGRNEHGKTRDTHQKFHIQLINASDQTIGGMAVHTRAAETGLALFKAGADSCSVNVPTSRF